MQEYKLRVQISDMEVDEEYYTLRYKIWVGTKVVSYGEINDDYQNGLGPKEQKRMLLAGEALRLALQRFD